MWFRRSTKLPLRTDHNRRRARSQYSTRERDIENTRRRNERYFETLLAKRHRRRGIRWRKCFFSLFECSTSTIPERVANPRDVTISRNPWRLQKREWASSYVTTRRFFAVNTRSPGAAILMRGSRFGLSLDSAREPTRNARAHVTSVAFEKSQFSA